MERVAVAFNGDVEMSPTPILFVRKAITLVIAFLFLCRYCINLNKRSCSILK